MNNLDDKFRDALEAFWTGRQTAQQRQIEAGKVDAGTRGAVTSGGHMSALEALIVELIAETNVPELEVKTGWGVELPGYYRPEKKWDLVVLSKDRLVAAIELKSQVISVGKNFNNRIEEAIGNATDLWTAFREGTLGTMPPFVGYLMLLGDIDEVHAKRTNREPSFKVDPDFRDTSYAERYSIFCRRLMLERLYQSTCLALIDAESPREYTCPDDSMSFQRFASQLQAHALGFANLTD